MLRMQGMSFFYFRIGDKKCKLHDIRRKNLTIHADTKREQVNKE